MVAQKHTRKLLAEIFCIFECLLPQNPSNQSSVDTSSPYRRLLENQKAKGCRKLFLPENDFQTSSKKDFPKKNIQILEVWKIKSKT